MTGTFNEFYKFIKTTNSDLCKLWEDFHNRADPQKEINLDIHHI